MTQHLVRTPLFAELNRRTLEIAVILLEFALEPRQQRKSVSSCARETRQYLIVIKAAHLLGARFHDGFAHRHLPVSRESNAGILPDEQYRRTANPNGLFVHFLLTRL